MFQKAGVKLLDTYVKAGAFTRVSEGDRLNMRMMILENMKEEGFYKYKDLLDRYVEGINDKINDASVLESDDPPFPRGSEPFWEEAIPGLKKFLPSWAVPGNSATGFLASKLIHIGVDALVGDAPTMTIQQKIMFKALISTYFSDDNKMFPISTNMDSVLFAEEIPRELDTSSEYYRLRQQRQRKSGTPKKVKKKLNVKNLFAAALSGSGPFMLKILQSVSTDNSESIGDFSVSEITAKVFSEVPAMTPEETTFVLDNLDIPEELIVEQKYIGSASIAQAHFASYKKDEEAKTRYYVMKIIKPMYAFYYLCELDFLLSKTWKAISYYAQRAVDKEFPGDEGRYKIIIETMQTVVIIFLQRICQRI